MRRIQTYGPCIDCGVEVRNWKAQRCKLCENKNRIGIKRPKSFVEKLRKIRLGSKNPFWKGENASYDAIHSWVRRNFKKPKRCNRCRKESRLDWANENMTTGRLNKATIRERKNWIALCRSCHMKMDGRINNLK